jgi:hypothetical protein
MKNYLALINFIILNLIFFFPAKNTLQFRPYEFDCDRICYDDCWLAV